MDHVNEDLQCFLTHESITRCVTPDTTAPLPETEGWATFMKHPGVVQGKLTSTSLSASSVSRLQAASSAETNPPGGRRCTVASIATRRPCALFPNSGLLDLRANTRGQVQRARARTGSGVRVRARAREGAGTRVRAGVRAKERAGAREGPNAIGARAG